MVQPSDGEKHRKVLNAWKLLVDSSTSDNLPRCSVCFVGLCRFVRVPFSACRVSRFVAIGLLVYFLLFFHNVQLVCRLLVVVFSPSWLSSPLSSCTFGSDSVLECTSSFFFLFVLGDRPPPGRGFGCTLFVHFCTSIP